MPSKAATPKPAEGQRFQSASTSMQASKIRSATNRRQPISSKALIKLAKSSAAFKPTTALVNLGTSKTPPFSKPPSSLHNRTVLAPRSFGVSKPRPSPRSHIKQFVASDATLTIPMSKSKSHAKRNIGLKAKKPITPEHPLLIAYNDAAATWTDGATVTLRTRLTAASDTITAHLASATEASAAFVADYNERVEAAATSLDDVTLEITLDVGTPDERHVEETLGECMRTFGELVRVEEKRLTALWGRWMEISTEVEGLKGGGTAFIREVEGLEEKVRRGREEIVNEYERECEKLKGDLERAEKMFERTQRTQKREFEKFVQAQISAFGEEVQEEEEEEEEEEADEEEED